MSELSKASRAKMREKAHRICQSDPNQRVDASDYRVPGAENAEKNTYPIQPKKRKYKHGGHVEGEAAKHHAGRKPRATGGRLVPEALNSGVYVPSAHTKLNPTRAITLAGAPPAAGVNKLATILGRQARKDGGHVHSDEAEDRKLVRKMVKKPALTGKCSGGRTERAKGGSSWGEGSPLKLVKTHTGPEGHVAKVYKDSDYGEYRVKHFSPEGKHLPAADYHTDDREDAMSTAASAAKRGFRRGGAAHRATGGRNVADGEQEGTRPTGGREARKSGGRTKGKTNINIIISQPKDGAGVGAPPPMMPPRPPMMPPPGAPPGGGAPLSNPQGGGGAPPPMMGPQGRKRGGRTYEATRLSENGAGSGGGLGRLKKIEAYGND